MSLLSVRLGEAQDKRLAEAADDAGCSRSDLVRAMIDGHIPGVGAVWIAYYPGDRTECVPFANEVDALRYAIDNHMKAIRVPYGTALSTAIDNEWAERHGER